MKKGLIKAVILAVIFVAALTGFSLMTNQANEDLTKEMEEASLPVVYLYSGDTKINELHGYVQEMNAEYMRDTITPVSVDKTIPMEINADEKQITGISYQIRSLDTEDLLVDTEVEDFFAEGHTVQALLPIQSIVDEGTEYILIIKLTDGEDSWYYYTRIIEPVDCYVQETLDFALEFHNTSMNPETYETLSSYIEPNSQGDNSSLHKVTINSSLKQVGWNGFPCSELTEPVAKLVEINSSYNVILLDYIVTTTGDDGELEYYNVEEYYRIRHTAQRNYLLNYERTMNQIYRGENAQFYDSFIELGIRDTEVNYKTNENGSVAAFVQEGELWSYNSQAGRLYQVFSFRGYEGIDDRENYNQHDIKIVGVDEAGSINFVVYGYMNRGDHEGESGIGVYHFDSISNTVEEEIFIPSDKSYEVLKSDIGNLLYESESGNFYIMLEGTIYEAKLGTLDTTSVLKNLEEGSYAISESNRYLAYQAEGDINSCTKLNIYDFETGSEYSMEAEAGEYLKPLGFMDEDFIYGAAKSEDVFAGSAGTVTFPMYKVCIMASDSTHELMKEYQKDGYYIAGIRIDDYTIYLNRIQFNGTAYVSADQDTIMNREGDSLQVVSIHTSVEEVRQTQVQIDLGTQITDTEPKLLTPKEVVLEEPRNVELEILPQGEKFYVYAQGRVLLSTYVLTDAVGCANDNMGVVIGEGQRYLWMRARDSSKSEISAAVGEEDAGSSSIAKCVNAVLGTRGINISVQAMLDTGSSPKEVLENSLRDVLFLDLTGCDVDETLFYLSQGTPVFAMSGADTAVLLTGYDSGSVTIYDPTLNSSYKMNLEEAETYFGEAGNVFFTYL